MMNLQNTLLPQMVSKALLLTKLFKVANHRCFHTTSTRLMTFGFKDVIKDKRYAGEEEQKSLREIMSRVEFENLLLKRIPPKDEEDALRARFEKINKKAQNDPKKMVILSLLNQPDKDDEIVKELTK